MRAPLFGIVHGYMIWNAFLAVVPVVLALALFRRRSSRSAAWWVVFGVWVLFLPNAPYVLTDVTHLADGMREAHSKPQAYAVLALFGMLFAIGLTAYVVALECFRHYLHRDPAVPARAVAPVLLTLHGLCVIAMYLGRVMRLNSWDVLTAPSEVARALLRVPRPQTVVVLAATFVVVGVSAFATKAVGDKVLAQARRFR